MAVVSDTIGDFLTRLRNAYRARHRTVEAPASRLKIAIAAILKEWGYIADYEYLEDNKQGIVRMKLRYVNGQPALREITRVSKPGRRVYAGADELPRVKNGLGIAIVSTSRGVMTDKEARRLGIGGEIICTVF
ncbi:30S ribosomal protein S8 [bacterium HR21]|uniref:Small ribosomal subunit protein uS8 n=1 Tax=uncultured Chlorobiota bacterium TaxID=156405 RepID=H5SGN9_9BACT|nr:30S ribosomal protein S8 [uncultured Chlorobiota bacterium]GBD06704.1 30S ribosomal protein S8 [bacterium HR21]